MPRRSTARLLNRRDEGRFHYILESFVQRENCVVVWAFIEMNKSGRVSLARLTNDPSKIHWRSSSGLSSFGWCAVSGLSPRFPKTLASEGAPSQLFSASFIAEFGPGPRPPPGKDLLPKLPSLSGAGAFG